MKIEHADAHAPEHDGDIVVPDVPDGAWEENGPFDHVLYDAAIEGDVTSVESNEVVNEEPSKRKERQERLLRERGFLATSPEELVRATGLTKFDMQSPGGAAKYIAVIIKRQNNLDPKPEDPAAAGRAVIGEMIDFAKMARGDRAGLEMLATFLDSSNLLPTTSVSEVPHLKDWQHEGLLRRAFVDLQRLAESVEFVEGNGSDHLGDPYGTSDDTMRKKLEKFVDSLSITEAKDLIYKSDEQHKAQLKFWIDRLDEIREHFMDTRIKGMAGEALASLGVTKPE